jgi:hypothetical protein
MNITEFVQKNKIALIIGAIVLTLIAIYMFNKKRESFQVLGEMGAGAMTLGGICTMLCTCLIPCCCWILILYYVTKKASAAAIEESSNK